MKTSKSILTLSFLSVVLLAACGAPQNSAESRLMGEPDFKAADGTNIMTWIKKSENSRAVCQSLANLKAQGLDLYSSTVASSIGAQFNLHPTEAEVINTYVLEFNCPELVR